MKKLLSIILACAMIMSLFCVVPTQATMIGSTYHYVFEDFEDGVSSVTAKKGSIEVVDTDNGSSKALMYTFASDTDYPDLAIPDKFGMRAGFTDDMTLRASVKYKLGTPLSKGYLTLLTVNSGDANYYSIHEITELTDTTNWHTAEFEINTFKLDADSVMFQLRIGNSGAKSTQAADGGDVEIYLDDLQITREKNTNKEVIKMNNGDGGAYFTYNTGSRAIAPDPLNSNNRALKATPSSNGGLYNLLYFQDRDGDITYKIGDTITVSCDVLVTGMWYEQDLAFRLYPRATGNGDDANAYISEMGSSYYTKKYLGSGNGQWQTLTWSFEVTQLSSGRYMPYIYLSENPNTTTDRTEDDDNRKDMGHYTYYFDNLTVTVSDRSDYIIPSATDLTATMAEDGTVTPSYTYSETTVEGVEAGTNVSLLKVKRANGAVIASAVAGGSLVIPEAYRDEDLTLEVLPVSSVGTFGDNVVSTVITIEEVVDPEPEPEPEPDPIVGITLIPSAGGITIETDTALTNAKLIFVTYDANGKMVSIDMSTAVTLDAQGTQEYPIPQGFTGAKVMLWNLTTLSTTPVTDTIQLN